MPLLTSPAPQLLTFKMFKVVKVDPTGKKKWAGTACSIKPSNLVTKAGSSGVGVKAVTVTVSFVARDSWVLQTHTSDSYLLEHEQLHYIVAICVGQKLYDDLLALTKSTSGELQSAVNELIAKTASLVQAISDKYDADTESSGNKTQQAVWAQRIRGWHSSKKLTW